MKAKPVHKRVAGDRVVLEGYQPRWPTGLKRIDPKHLKPPKGGSAIQPPNNSKPVKP